MPAIVILLSATQQELVCSICISYGTPENSVISGILLVGIFINELDLYFRDFELKLVF